METQLDKMEKDLSELKKAWLGDNFGNIGYMKRMVDIENHIEESKKRLWVERGVWIGVTFIGILSNVLHFIK